MPRIAVQVDEEDVFVCFGGLDLLWTLRRTVRISRESITDVSVGPAPARRGLRLPGTTFPGLLAAGIWVYRGGNDLWDVRRGERVLVIDCNENGPYRRIVLEVADPDHVAERLRPTIPRRSRPAKPPGPPGGSDPSDDQRPASWR